MIIDLVERLSSQHRRLFKFHHLNDPDQPLLLESFTGADGLSQPFTYELQLICDTDNQCRQVPFIDLEPCESMYATCWPKPTPWPT